MLCAYCTRPTEQQPCEHCGSEPMLDGRYRLEAVLGRGATGTTWRALDPEDHAVAIKSMPMDRGAGAKERELLEREVRVLRALSHPGIPAYVEHLVLTQGPDTALWLVQELVPGMSLAQELEEHRYAPREVLAIVAELAGILDYLHSLSPPVIHRDVKPGNVMRRPDGGLALVDFGSVRDVAKGTLGGSTVAGTFGYMAPEQFAGDAEPRSDLYGLGALAVALLTRKEPQSLSDHANRLRWTSHARVTGAVHDLLNRLVEPELERRAPDAAWVQQRAELMLAAGDLEPATPSAPATRKVDEVLERKPRGLRWWALALAAMVAAGAVPVAVTLRATLMQPKLLVLEPTLPVAPPEPVSADGKPVKPRNTATGVGAPMDPEKLVVTTIGEDPSILACLDRHTHDHADQPVRIEVLVEPPAEVGSVLLSPPQLMGSELARCLDAAVRNLAFRGVALERTATVTLEFD
jgi:hypothetical protein